jgi:hypothetical protein
VPDASSQHEDALSSLLGAIAVNARAAGFAAAKQHDGAEAAAFAGAVRDLASALPAVRGQEIAPFVVELR